MWKRGKERGLCGGELYRHRALGTWGGGRAHGVGPEPGCGNECVDSSACLSSARSQYLLLCPSPQASTAEICTLWSYSSLTPRVYTQRPPGAPKHLESRSYGLTNHTNLRRPAVVNTRTRSPDPGTQFNGFPHPSIQPCIHPSLHAYMHACIPYKSVDRSADSSLPGYGLRTGAPFAALLPSAQPRPPPRGENSSITKGAKKRIPGLKRPAHRSFSGPRFCSAFPTPTVHSSGAVGDAPRC